MQPYRTLIGLGISIALASGALSYNATERHRQVGDERSLHQAMEGFPKTGNLNVATQELAAAGNEAVSRVYKVIEILNAQETSAR